MDNIITLNSKSGEVHFEFLDLVEYCGDEFAVLLPADNPEEIGEVVILKLDTIDEDTEEASYSKRHCKYRVVRPMGTIPPGETSTEILEAEYEPASEEEPHEVDT